MAEISAGDVAKLRQETGAGMMDCKKALTEADGDFDKARILLRERGLADADQAQGTRAKDGLIHAYLHAPEPGYLRRIGVMLEINTETDFVAKTDQTRRACPRYRDAHRGREAGLRFDRGRARGGPRARSESSHARRSRASRRRSSSRRRKARSRSTRRRSCLLEQPWVRDEKQTIGQLVASFAPQDR